MAIVGLFASWGAALFAAWAFVGGLAGTTPGHPARRSAERALVAAAIAAAVATAALVQLLLAGDVTISYVARSIATNLPNGYRVAALWNLPAGAVLPTATLAALAGGLATAHARSSLGVAAVGAIVMALMAASLAAMPFDTLPWTPTEGLGLSPTLQHPMSVAGRVALSCAVAAATALVALAADHLSEPAGSAVASSSERVSGDRSLDAAPVMAGMTLALVALVMWAVARGGYATGGAPSPAPPTAWGGALVPALVSVAFAAVAARTGGTAFFAAALGALGLLSAVLLGRDVPRAGGWAMDAFALTSLVAAASGAAVAVRRARGRGARLLALLSIVLLAVGSAATRGIAGAAPSWVAGAATWSLVWGLAAAVAADGTASPYARWLLPAFAVAGAALGATLWSPDLLAMGWCTVAGLALGAAVSALVPRATLRAPLTTVARPLAIALAALAAAGESRSATTVVTLTGGGRTTVAMHFGPPLVLSHQGISRYEIGNAHVAALALEPSRGGSPMAIVTTDRREYVDGRDEILGPPTTRPVIVAFALEELRIAVDDVRPDEGARLRLTVAPLALAWPLALIVLALAALLGLRPRSAYARLPASTHTVTA